MIEKLDATLGIFTVKRISCYQGEYYTYGGFGLYLSEIRKHFKKTIMVAHVAEKKPEEGYYLIDNKNNDLEIIHLPQCRNELENWIQIPYSFIKAFPSVKRMDIVHNRMPDYTGIIGAVICKIINKPYFVQTIADWAIEAKKTPMLKKMGLGTLLKLDYYWYDFLERCVSKNQLVFAQGYTCYEKHKDHADARLISSTAHFNEDLGSFKERFQDDNNIKVLNVARITGIKNQQLIIRAIAQLNDQTEQNWSLEFLGFGPLQGEMEKLSEELGIQDKILFRGQVDRGDVFWRYYDNVDVFVLSSRSEGTPKVLLESMARSLPIVASNVGGIPYLAPHEERGLLFEENNVQALVDALKRMRKDNKLRNTMARNGMVFAKENTLENATIYMVDAVKKMMEWD